MAAAIVLEDVRKAFGGHVAVEGLDLAVPEGALQGFIGPNGSGKTTTLRILLRIYAPDRGRVVVLGSEHTAAVDDRVGYLPEERGLYRAMPVGRQLEFFAALKGVSRPRPRVDGWLERFGLLAWRDKPIESLSKGMAQKVQFVAAAVSDPRLLVLDEPFSGLDPVSTEVLCDAMLDLHRHGTTILFSTHDMAMAERLCDRIAMMHRGRKVLDGTLREIKERWGQDTLRLRFRGERPDLGGLAGVDEVRDLGREVQLRLAPAADRRGLMATLLARAEVERFEFSQPSLHDVFVRIAGADLDPPEEAA